VTPEQLAAADAQTADLRTQTATLQATAKSLRSSLAALNSTLSTADLVRSVQVLDAEKTEIEARLDSLRAGRAKKVTPQERAEGERMWKVCGAAKMRRERIAREMWQMIEDGVPDVDKRVELREAMGLDE
jgi:26S proteasome regulatory subunit (ATPase 3-interacting protein)